jgi:murein DD-endopeptidase MepM/ murein hydrolase activator NlpD
MRYFILFILIFTSTTILFGKNKLFIDNREIQQYKGKLGHWLKPSDKFKLNSLIKKYSVTLKDIRKINGTKTGTDIFIFIPYSEKYLETLRKKGIERKSAKIVEGREFLWPINSAKKISSSYGKRWGEFHKGIDLPAAKWTPVLAAMDGKVISASYQGGHGNSIVIEHRNNFFTRYSHNTALIFKPGDFVKQGQVIAFVGSTGDSTGNHLHFEIRFGKIALNPVDFLPKREELDVVGK